MPRSRCQVRDDTKTSIRVSSSSALPGPGCLAKRLLGMGQETGLTPEKGRSAARNRNKSGSQKNQGNLWPGTITARAAIFLNSGFFCQINPGLGGFPAQIAFDDEMSIASGSIGKVVLAVTSRIQPHQNRLIGDFSDIIQGAVMNSGVFF